MKVKWTGKVAILIIGLLMISVFIFLWCATRQVARY
jgi:hypothetical protein